VRRGQYGASPDAMSEADSLDFVEKWVEFVTSMIRRLVLLNNSVGRRSSTVSILYMNSPVHALV
jgi:hypothetical protein